MAYPDGLVVRGIQTVPLVGASGKAMTGKLAIVPSTSLKWSADGTLLLKQVITFPLVNGVASGDLPTNQPGLVDSDGNDVDSFSYSAFIQESEYGSNVPYYAFELADEPGVFTIDFSAPYDVDGTRVVTPPDYSASGFARTENFTISSAENTAIDEAVSALQSDPESSTGAGLNATIAAGVGSMRGNRLVVLGDSITIAAEAGTLTTNRAPSYGSAASFLSRGRLGYIRNAGIAGNTSAQMLARFDTDVAAYSPSIVHVLAGTNDSNDGAPVPIATFAANMQTLVAKIRAIGAMPVLGTVPPNEVSSNRKARVTAYNAWLRRYAMSEGIVLVDYYRLLVDPANGDILTAYDLDGTHPNNAGQIAMGRLLWDTLEPYVAPSAILMPQDAADPNNIVTGGLFLAGTGVGPGSAHLQPNGWTLNTAQHPTGVTAALVDDVNIQGKWYKITMAGASGTSLIFQNVPAGKVLPNHVYAFMGRFKTTGFLNTDSGARPFFYTRVLFNGTQNNPATDLRAVANNWSYQIDDGVFGIEVTAPADAATMQVQFTIGTTGGAASGAVHVAQVGLYDLTSMGVV